MLSDAMAIDEPSWTADEAARLVGVGRDAILAWADAGVVAPSLSADDGGARWGERDLVALCLERDLGWARARLEGDLDQAVREVQTAVAHGRLEPWLLVARGTVALVPDEPGQLADALHLAGRERAGAVIAYRVDEAVAEVVSRE
jgi:hypothetical protein